MSCVWLLLLCILSQERKANFLPCISYRHIFVAIDGAAIDMFHLTLLNFCLKVEQRHFFPRNTSVANWHLTFIIREQRYSMWTCLHDFTKFVILLRQEISLNFFWNVTYCPQFGAERKVTEMKLPECFQMKRDLQGGNCQTACIRKRSWWVIEKILLPYK